MLFSVWSTDVLVIALAGDQAAMWWMSEPLHMWRRIEEGNMSTSVLGEFILDQDVLLPAPPKTLWDFTEATSITNTVGIRKVGTGLNRHNRPSPKIISSELSLIHI